MSLADTLMAGFRGLPPSKMTFAAPRLYDVIIIIIIIIIIPFNVLYKSKTMVGRPGP
jgi:hypothetical protein